MQILRCNLRERDKKGGEERRGEGRRKEERVK
jgi:hypothetical protein